LFSPAISVFLSLHIFSDTISSFELLTDKKKSPTKTGYIINNVRTTQKKIRDDWKVDQAISESFP
jgi:hypothetical protein